MNMDFKKFTGEEHLDEYLSRPGKEVTEMFSKIDGDIIFLGATGKTGPYLARMARRACDEAGIRKRILGVARFGLPGQKEYLERHGIETISGDLLDSRFLESLPPVRNVFFLAGMKFGSADNLPATWAVNTWLPGLVAGHFRNSRIVAFSTGCVYPLVPTDSGGSVESGSPEASGEYAQSCLGRERMFEYGSNKYKTPVTIIRLNYAVEMRYGVLVDIASRVLNREEVDLSMGYFNVIWQGDMNDFVLRSLEHTDSPAKIINITGPETLSVREVTEEFGKLFGIPPRFVNSEAGTALLSNSSEAFRLFGMPRIKASRIISWTAEWLKEGKKLLGKPTHFEIRDGKY